MKALVMAAGLATRLRPYTEHAPKAMLPVRGRPLIDYTIDNLVRGGHRDIYINLHHHGKQIVDHLGDGEAYGARITYSWEKELLETGGTVVRALPHLRPGPFVVTNADILTDYDFSQLPTALPDGDIAHLVLTPTPSWREGDFDYANGRVLRRGQSHVYCSISVLTVDMFADAPEGPFSWRDLMFAGVESDRIGAEEHLGEWWDIGNVEQYEAVR